MDINGDGKLDILSGSYSRYGQDMAGLLQVLYGESDTFRKAEVLKGTDGKPLIIPTEDEDNIIERICTRPFAVDWDGDGDLDLIVGNFAGTLYWFKGEGQGKFAPKPELIETGGSPLKVAGYHADPFVVDWDGDGDLDVLSGSSLGGVVWAENTAGKGKVPDLQAFETLISPSPRNSTSPETLRDKDLKGSSGSTRVWAADINSDGKLDLLVGDSVSLISPAEGFADDDLSSKYEVWIMKVRKASEDSRVAEGKFKEKARDKLNALYKQRSEFMTEDMTGFVWLYVQK